MVVTARDMIELNLMAGGARSLEQKVLTPDDQAIWNRDFTWLVAQLTKLDPDVGAEMAGEARFYEAIAQVAKGYFNDKPFGGFKCATGQFGMNLIAPQHLAEDASGTKEYYSWQQTVTLDSADSDADILGGSTSSKELFAETSAEEKEVIAFHTLISYKPDPRIIALEIKINDYPYPLFVVEPFAKINKPDKLFKFIPLPGRIVLHPGGKFYIRGWFDVQTGLTAPSGTPSIDIEVGQFGLVFAEYNQFLPANWT